MIEVHESVVAVCEDDAYTASLALVWPVTGARQAVLYIRTQGGEPAGHAMLNRADLERLLHGEPGESLLLQRPDGQRMELRLVLENGERWLWLMGPGRLAFRAAALEEALDRAEEEREGRLTRRLQAKVAVALVLFGIGLPAGAMLFSQDSGVVGIGILVGLMSVIPGLYWLIDLLDLKRWAAAALAILQPLGLQVWLWSPETRYRDWSIALMALPGLLLLPIRLPWDGDWDPRSGAGSQQRAPRWRIAGGFLLFAVAVAAGLMRTRSMFPNGGHYSLAEQLLRLAAVAALGSAAWQVVQLIRERAANK